MKTLNKESVTAKINKPRLFILRYALSSFAVFSLAFILLKFPVCSMSGVRKGMEICFETLIPSLYPFMILTNIYSSSEAAKMNIGILNKFCRFLFGLPGNCFFVVLFSFIGGLPVGAMMSEQLYEQGRISKEQFCRMLCFCVNPGPAFVISAVGTSMLGSKKAGLIIYLSLVLSSMIIGVATRFFSSENEESMFFSADSKASVSKVSVVEKAVVRSSKSVFMICAWVVAFSCFNELISDSSLSDGIKRFLLCTSEMTNGSLVASASYSMPVVAAVIGFSGFCGHLQLMGQINRAQLGYKCFLVSRIINSGISAVICSVLLNFFPVATETFALGTKPERGDISGSAVLSVLMIIMAALFIVGDDYKLIKKTKKV